MQPWVERIYESSPVLGQNLLLSLYGWKLKRLRYGGSFRRYLDELLRSQRCSAAELAELQRENLRRLIRHCYEQVPYYTSLMRERKLAPDDFRDPADLEKLPILEKETVRQNPEQFLARNFRNLPGEIVSTSGTSGKTLRIRVDREGRRRNYAFFARLKHWAGVEPLARAAIFAGRTIVPTAQQRPPFWRYNLAGKSMLCSSYHLSERNMPAYLGALRKWDPQVVDSYPSSADTLARFGLERGEAGPGPRAVITSSETLLPQQRERIERFFQAAVFDHYGAAEQACLITQCEKGTYHIHPEFGITELLAGGDSEARRIVATGFTNWAMPLLRYNTGDLAVPSSDLCPCGRHFPCVREILGRVDDVLVTPDGRLVGRLDPAFKGIETIRAAQIVQEALGRVRIRIVPGRGYSQADEDALRRELEKRLGREIDYIFETVEEIPAGAGGKFRAVICRIPKEERPGA